MRGLHAPAHEARSLLTMGSREAEPWITANDYETEATKRDRQEKEAELGLGGQPEDSREDVAQDGGDDPHFSETVPSPPPNPQLKSADDDLPVIPASTSHPSPPSLHPAPQSPPAKRTIAQTEIDTLHQPSSSTAALPSRSAVRDYFKSDNVSDPSSAPRIGQAPTKKLKIDISSRQLDSIVVPVSTGPPDLFISNIPRQAGPATVEAALQERLPSAVYVKVIPFDNWENNPTWFTKARLYTPTGSRLDVPSIAATLKGAEIYGFRVHVQVNKPNGSKSSAREEVSIAAISATQVQVPVVPPSPPAQTLTANPKTPSPLPPHLCQSYFVIKPGPINDAALRTLFSHSLRIIGKPEVQITSLEPSLGRQYIAITLKHPVDASSLLADLNGKVIAEHALEVVRADQPAPARQPPPHHNVPRQPPSLQSKKNLPQEQPPPRPSTAPPPPEFPPPPPTTAFTVRNLARGTISTELEQLFRPICDACASPNTVLKATIVSGKKGKLVGHVVISAKINIALASGLLRGQVLRGKQLVVEAVEGSGNVTAASFAGSPEPNESDVRSAESKEARPADTAARARSNHFYVENLGRAAQPPDVEAAFAGACGPRLVSSVTIVGGGGSAIVALTQPLDAQELQEKMESVKINGRKLIITPHESTESAVQASSQNPPAVFDPPSPPLPYGSANSTEPVTSAPKAHEFRRPSARHHSTALPASTVPSATAAVVPSLTESPARPRRRHEWDSDGEEDISASPVPPSVASLSTQHDRKASTSSASSTKTGSRMSSATSPSASPAAEQPSGHFARLAALNFHSSDLKAVENLMLPLATPPSTGFDRTAKLEASFGYLRPLDAKLALEAQTGRREFGDDEAMQLGYEKFLESQTGESRDHYTM